jgi:uncharacterized protein (TIGR00730 family)
VEAEISHPGLTALRVVETMHERKTAMAALSDGFITLPGGPGTLEEIFEQWTWGLLGIHAKPCGFVDVGGYFAPLRAMIETMIGAGFLRRDHGDMLAAALRSLCRPDPQVPLGFSVRESPANARCNMNNSRYR